jgi:hypothetical protein
VFGIHQGHIADQAVVHDDVRRKGRHAETFLRACRQAKAQRERMPGI